MERRYPSPVHDHDMITAKVSVSYLLGVPRTRLEEVDLFSPHMPHAIIALLGLDLFTVVAVRNPIDRVRSVLDLMASDVNADGTGVLERVYSESEWARSWLVANQLGFYLGTTGEQLQRIIAKRPDPHGFSGVRDSENARAILGTEDELVTSACRTLESIDAVGLTEGSEELASELAIRLDLPKQSAPRVHVGAGRDLSADLRRRLEVSTAADMMIYEFARDLVARRRAKS